MIFDKELIKIAENYHKPITLIHSDILGGLKFDYKNRIQFLKNHQNALKKLFDNSEIWMPTFNYDFCKGDTFNVKTTPTVLGVINEDFRKNISNWRTNVPVFSFSGTGESPKINQSTKIDAFGENSAFDYLYKKKALLIHYGSQISSSTIIHYAEKMSKKLTYRYSKSFIGDLVDNELNKYTVNLDFHVRPLNHYLEYDFNKIENDLIKNRIMKIYKFDNTRIIFIHIDKFVDFILDSLNTDHLYLLDKKSRDWVEDLLNKLGRPFLFSDFESINQL